MRKHGFVNDVGELTDESGAGEIEEEPETADAASMPTPIPTPSSATTTTSPLPRLRRNQESRHRPRNASPARGLTSGAAQKTAQRAAENNKPADTFEVESKFGRSASVLKNASQHWLADNPPIEVEGQRRENPIKIDVDEALQPEVKTEKESVIVNPMFYPDSQAPRARISNTPEEEDQGLGLTRDDPICLDD